MFKHKNLMMMKMMMKICCAAVLALGLAACGDKETVAPVITPAAPATVAPEPDPSIEAGKLSDAQEAAMTASTDARTAADDAQEAADTVADLTGNDSAQAMAAQKAADAADTAATAAEDASERAQAATMSADAEGEQMTAETEQGNADDQLEIAQELQSESELAAAAVGQALQVRDIATAQEMAKAAAAAALDHFNSADQKSKDARAKAVEARSAASRAMRARTDFDDADKQATAAETAATEAEMARADAWTAVAAANAASMSAMDATTLAGAQMYQEDAEDAEDAAEEQATGAGMNYMDAMDAAAAAETAAGTHVLRLFTSANAYDVTNEDAAALEVASVGAAIALAANAPEPNQAGNHMDTGAAWVKDVPAVEDTDADAVPGLLEITFNSGATANGGFTTIISEARADDDTADTAIKNNAKQTNVGGDFPHMFDISDGRTRVLVFTDKEQDTPGVEVVTARTLVGVLVTPEHVQAGNVKSLGESRDGGTTVPGTYDPGDDTIIEGTFKCDGDCTLDYTGSGDKGDLENLTMTNYTFSGSREGVTKVEADAKQDYLLFGVWLDEVAAKNAEEEANDNAGADTFGAFATGGQPFFIPEDADTDATVTALKGKATYSGTAVGAHHKTGSGVSSFDGDATLTADFDASLDTDTDTDTDKVGTIEGTIDNISVDGGDPMKDSIHLVKTNLTSLAVTSPDIGTSFEAFNGRAVMGQQLGPGLEKHTFNGTWSGGFFGNGEKATDHPGSVAGTFGVTNTTGMDDDAVTESYVGAFGAHRK